MARDGRADCNYDRRYRALVLLATFASLRWCEATALRRCDIDLDAGTLRVRAAYVERSTGEIILGPPKSKAGRRIVGIRRVILPELRHHLVVFAKPDPGALALPGAKGGPLRRGNFSRSAAWPQAVAVIEAPGMHFHDLRHAGNTFAAASGAGQRDLRPGWGTTVNVPRSSTSTRHAAPTPPSRTRSTPTSTKSDLGTMARGATKLPGRSRPRLGTHVLTWAFT